MKPTTILAIATLHQFHKEHSAYGYDALFQGGFANDPGMVSSELEPLLGQQAEILKTATPASLVDGRYGAVTKRYYERLEELVRGTKYEPIAEFRHRRDQEIGRKIIEFVQQHRGARIALAMGANHHVYAVETLSQHLGGEAVVFEQPRRRPRP